MAHRYVAPSVVLLVGGLCAWFLLQNPKALSSEELAKVYETPLPAPEGPMNTYHLGHSLVGRDMPAMLEQLAGHDYASQLGWGTPLKAHWEPAATIQGFETENAHPHYMDAKEALKGGTFDAFVFTEMVEIVDAIDYFESPKYVEKWVRAAREGNPDIRTYLFESWHELDDPQGWLERLDIDPERYWEGVLTAQSMAAMKADQPIYIIPAGRVFAEFVRRLEATECIDGVKSREDLFARHEDGSVDPIHVNDLGAYLVALTHYAVLYQKSPVGLPYALELANGERVTGLGPELAALMQRTVWDVVTKLSATGIDQS